MTNPCILNILELYLIVLQEEEVEFLSCLDLVVYQNLLYTETFDMEKIEYNRVAIYFTDIIGNKGDIGSALKLQGHYYSACENVKSMSVRLINVSINANSPNEATLQYGTAAVYVNIIHWLVLKDTCFYNNTGVGVYANNSDI